MNKLPQIKYPVFSTKLPSTNQSITYRPWNVGEEKILLVASESSDAEQIKLALRQVLSACVTDAPDIVKWTTFDIEFVYLQIRSKSVSATLDLKVRLIDCPEKDDKTALCDTENLVKINIDDIKLMIKKEGAEPQPFKSETYKMTTQIKLNDEVGVKLKHPSYSDLDIIKTVTEESSADELGYELLARCTVSLYDTTSEYNASDFTVSELKTWYKQLRREDLKPADDFFKDMPILLHTCKFKCRKCNKDSEYTLEGISHFFG